MIKYSIRLKIDLRVGAIIIDSLQLMISPRNILKNLAVFYTEVRSVQPQFLRNTPRPLLDFCGTPPIHRCGQDS